MNATVVPFLAVYFQVIYSIFFEIGAYLFGGSSNNEQFY